jgi:2-polyprenyl-3-methyl-5-hydroxy-6-metoxy-1,4-benzoquinol methylase
MLVRALRLAKLIRRIDIHEHEFNVPIKIDSGKIRSVNERIIELSMVQRFLADLPIGKRILEFGCTRSWLSLSLASMGYKVIGVDLRDFPIKHPNFSFHKGEIQKLDIEPVDCIVAVSTLEHVGIGAYAEETDEHAMTEVLEKLNTLLVDNGQLILSVPVGIPAIDSFQRIFSPEEITALLKNYGFTITKAKYFTRTNETTWLPCDQNSLKEGDFYSGVSSVACLLCTKNK